MAGECGVATLKDEITEANERDQTAVKQLAGTCDLRVEVGFEVSFEKHATALHALEHMIATASQRLAQFWTNLDHFGLVSTSDVVQVLDGRVQFVSRLRNDILRKWELKQPITEELVLMCLADALLARMVHPAPAREQHGHWCGG